LKLTGKDFYPEKAKNLARFPVSRQKIRPRFSIKSAVPQNQKSESSKFLLLRISKQLTPANYPPSRRIFAQIAQAEAMVEAPSQAEGRRRLWQALLTPATVYYRVSSIEHVLI